MNPEGRSRFVCPNDRQLALRAKLNTGWSMKTATIGYSAGVPKTAPLDTEEQEAIVQVIRRAEQIDIYEQERIGKLIEKLESMRRNALGRTPSQCLLCGDGFRILGAQKVVCMDCKRLACQKCAINNSPNSSKEHWLCLICAETREIWKKSGAWFFNSLPKYTLPVDSGRITRTKSVRKSKKYTKEEDSSSDEERRVFFGERRRNSSTESTQDVAEQTPPNLNTSISYFSTSESVISRDGVCSSKNYPSSVTLNELKSWEDSGTEARGDSEGSETSRRESMASRSISEWNWSDGKNEDKISPSSSSVNSNIFKTNDYQKSTTPSMGIIELSLTYDVEASTLHCTVYRAKNLIPTDMSCLADPFCKLNILPNAKVSTRLRTKTVHKTRNPEFNEHLTFYDITETDLMKKSLYVLVVDDDKYGHDYMGETRISLARLKVQNTIYLTVPLENLRPEQKGPLPAPELNEWFDDLWSRGQILLSLCYSTKKRSLLVTVVKCINLLPMDNNGFSDPFVKLQLKPDPYHKKHRTSVKWKNLNPEFNEEFAFETRPMELCMQSLYVTVYDKDYGKRNDYLGGLIIGGTGSKGQRLKHWLDMIKYPDHRHEQWHNLTEDVLE